MNAVSTYSRRWLTCGAVLLSSLACVGICLGQAVITDTGGATGFDTAANPANYGFSFTVGAQDISVTSLGVWDETGLGLITAHDVGLYDSSQVQLRTVTVPSGTTGTKVGEFRYMSVTPITLQAGQTYYLAAYYDGSTGSGSTGDTVALATTATVGAGIIKGDARNSSTTDQLHFPDLDFSGANDGVYGPNAQFTAVPEPETYAAVTALALLGFAVWRRTKTAGVSA